MSDSNKAVFLSYASQDAEAAKKICDALRASGIEVWFDQSELVGGDAWDAKIRGQIGSCALFVPVISANTQARLEGYFRLEWKLAAQRTHTMAEEKVFLLPIVIDATRDAEAKVPAEFRAVQWTRLPGGETPEKFCDRAKKILGGAGGPAVAEVADRGSPSARLAPAQPRRWALRVTAAAFALGSALVAFLWLRHRAVEAPTNPRPDAAVASTAPHSAAAALAERAFVATQKIGFTRDDLAMAEALAAKATEVDSDSARAWGVRAWVQAAFMNRTWDSSAKRREDAQTFANRAFSLNPDEPEALNALAQVLHVQGADAAAEPLARRAMAAAPDNRRSRVLLAVALSAQQRRAEAVAVMLEELRRHPDDVLARYELAVSYTSFEPFDLPAAEEQLDAIIDTQPFASALVFKARVTVARRGDLPAMRAALDRLEQMPLSDRADDRAVYVTAWSGLLERKPERVFTAVALTAHTYFEDNIVQGPKSWLTAQAYRIAGRENLAQLEWRAAETVLRERLRNNSDDAADTARLAITLAWLGRNADAAELMAPLEAALREQLTPARARLAAQYYAALGDAAKAAPYLRACLGRTLWVTRDTLSLDPSWDKLRGQPEFEALLAEAKKGPATAEIPAKADEKSVAVLAFANLSDDKGNEYFSDGISEELLNVLAKIPGLKVSARTSAFYFKGKQVPIADIAKQLGVAYVVEGSVRKSGSRVRITAQLIKAADGFHVWSENFDRELKDIFAVQDEIAALVSKNLQLKMGVVSQESRREVNPEAHRLVLEGRHYWNLRTTEGFTKAEAAFTKAITLDPQFAQAHAGLADVLITKAIFQSYAGFNSQETAAPREEIRRTLALDPTLAEAYPASGSVLMWEGRLLEAEQEFRKAIALNSNYALAHHWYSLVLELQGRLDIALAEIDQAIQLDPLSISALATRERFLVAAGRFSEALAADDQVRALRPDFLFIAGERALCLLNVGRKDDAIAVARSIGASDSMDTRWMKDAAAIHVLRQTGHESEAAAQVAALLPRLPTDSYLRGTVLAVLGRWDEAVPFLERTPIGLREIYYWNPVWDAWRDDPRFLKLMVKLGCVEEYKVARETRSRMLKQSEVAKK